MEPTPPELEAQNLNHWTAREVPIFPFIIGLLLFKALRGVQPFRDPTDYIACRAALSVGFPGKNTGVGCGFLLQGLFPTWD